MSELLMQWPSPLQKAVVEEFTRRGLSMSEWLAEAASEKIQADAEQRLFQTRAARGNREAYLAVLATVPDVPPMAGDEPTAPQ